LEYERNDRDCRILDEIYPSQIRYFFCAQRDVKIK
jgi:hypothetical protein